MRIPVGSALLGCAPGDVGGGAAASVLRHRGIGRCGDDRTFVLCGSSGSGMLGGVGGGYAVHMGHVQVNAEISNADGTRSREVEPMVDTGATYTFLPGSMLRELGIAPTRTTNFQLASGEMAQYARGEAVIRINGFAQMTPVVFGDDDAEPLIGVVTLEQLELAVDPVADALIPARPRL